MAKRERIGIFGGTFNPPHLGHLLCAQTALKKVPLDRVILVPVGNPPHREVDDNISGSARLAMTEVLIAGEPDLEVSDYEITREDTSYTVDTLGHFHSLYPDADLFLIIGTDQALKMREWREPQRLAELATIVVANRDALHEPEARKAVAGATGREGLFVETSFMSVSSTIVRKRFAEGGEISRMTGEGVAALYADTMQS